MSESLTELIDRMRPRITVVREEARACPPAGGGQKTLPSFVIEGAAKTVITVPLELTPEVAAGPSANIEADDFLLRLSGRLVEAGRANGNGAFWAQEDLEFGLPSVAHGPLNWLHDEQRVVGALTSAKLVGGTTREAAGVGAHIRSDAVLWRWLAPREAAVLAEQAGLKQAYFSMECISRQIQCTGENGCGQVMDYLDAQGKTEKACQHVRERSSHRRFVSPIFQGAAIIVPPTKPGWAQADLEVVKPGEKLAEAAGLELQGLSDEQAANMLGQIVSYAAA
jgi:hypothetical protein